MKQFASEGEKTGKMRGGGGDFALTAWRRYVLIKVIKRIFVTVGIVEYHKGAEVLSTLPTDWADLFQ